MKEHRLTRGRLVQEVNVRLQTQDGELSTVYPVGHRRRGELRGTGFRTGVRHFPIHGLHGRSTPQQLNCLKRKAEGKHQHASKLMVAFNTPQSWTTQKHRGAPCQEKEVGRAVHECSKTLHRRVAGLRVV